MRIVNLIWQTLSDRARRLQDETGSMALTFALTASALVFVVLGATQIAMTTSGKTRYQGAADTAVLAAITPSTANADMEAVARATFMANLTPAERAAVTQLQITTETGRVRMARLTYKASQPAIFPAVSGGTNAVISGAAQARKADYRYVDVDLWLDGSASMGVAADEAGRDALRALSRLDPSHRNCAFACHMPTPLIDNNLYATSEQRAHANGIRLRHDIMKESVNILIDELNAAYPLGLRARFGVARMARGWERQLNFTADVTAAKNFVSTFRLAGTTHSQAASRLSPAITAGGNTLSTGAGDGSQNNPEKFIIIVTDGMQFDWNAISPGPIAATACQAVRAKGYRVAVVQLRYVRLDGDGAFNTWVRPVYDQITPALQNCASAGYYFHANNPDEVRTAFRQLAATLEESLRLTE